MKILLIIVFSLCSCGFPFTLAFQIVKIGAIFFHNEVDLLEAFEVAIRDINERDLNVRLEPLKHFLSLDDSIAIQQLTCDLIENGAAAIFGPSSKSSSDIVEIICNNSGIPHLQYDWHEMVTQRQRNNHRMTVNVAPSEASLSTAYWDILRSNDFDWKSFTIIYEKSSSLSRMQHLFAWKFVHKSGMKLKEFQRGDDYRILWKIVSNSREKFVLLECPPDILGDVISASIFFNMTGPFNHLFLTNLDTHFSDIGKFYAKDFTVTTAAVRLRTYIPAPIQHEIDVFDDDDEEKFLSLRTQLIYDAVVLFANAVNNVVQSMRYQDPNVQCGGRGYWKTGPFIISEIKGINFKNVTPPFRTQRLQINELGERSDFNLEIYNPLTERITHIWNKQHFLVSFDKISENSTKNAKKRRLEEKEDFSQKRVRYIVATRVGEPYFMWRQEPEGVHFEGNERFEGYAVDLIYKLAEECKFDFIFEPVHDNKYGSYDPVTDEWNGIIRELIDNNAQIGICDLTITQARRAVVDFTVPFMQLGISILYYRPPPPPKNLFGFLKPFALEVWVYLLVACAVTTFIAKLTTRISIVEWEIVEELDDRIVLENKWSFFNTVWFMVGSIMTTGCDILPRGPPFRLITTFLWIFALLLSQTYIAKLASFITSSKMEGSIRHLHDLVEQNKIQFGTVKGGSTTLFFSESNESDYRVAWNKMISMKPDAFTGSNKEGVDRVKRSRGRYAFLMETTNLQYYVERNCELTQIGEPFGEKHYGIAVPLNAPFRSNLSVGILKLSEKGVLYTLKNKWFNSNTTECSLLNSGTKEQSTQFTMDTLGGLFIVLIGGILVAIVVGVCEFFWHIQRITVKEKVSYMVALKGELDFYIRFWLIKKPIKPHLRKISLLSNGSTSSRRSSSTSTVKKKKKLRKNSSKTA